MVMMYRIHNKIRLLLFFFYFILFYICIQDMKVTKEVSLIYKGEIRRV